MSSLEQPAGLLVGESVHQGRFECSFFAFPRKETHFHIGSMYGFFTYIKGETWLHSGGNVGKYSLHGSFGRYKDLKSQVD